MTSPRKIELLAPARDINVARQAIAAGADAIYIGPSSHGARAAAGNSIDDIALLVEEAHPFGVKVYATVNTLVYDNEIDGVERLIKDLYRIGVDALIIQDMGILRMNIPPIDLHASTQCDIRSVDKAKFLASVGFSRIVLARELSEKQIAEIHSEVDAELEAFIHGALCVSYSGDCRASFATTGRSANRGECAQICRLKFDLTDSSGKKLAPSGHYLSLRDLNRLEDVGALIDAGVSSLKIEGRLKDASYVVNTVAAYRRRIDKFIAESSGKYQRASWGSSSIPFNPDVTKSFNRGFTSYFFSTPSRDASMASVSTPKMIGSPVGKVLAVKGGCLIINANEKIVNGDGLGFFTSDGILTGFRVNRIDGNKIFPATDVKAPIGATLYRNRDKAFDDTISKSEVERKISVSAHLTACNDGIALTFTDGHGHRATATKHLDAMEKAKTPQLEGRRKILSKLGDTIYSLDNVADELGDTFIPASLLTSLRREAIEALKITAKSCYQFRYRGKESFDTPLPSTSLTMHDNVSNRLAKDFYLSHGALTNEPALEVAKQSSASNLHVMTTKYCIRRELGCCLKTPQATRLPEDLYLRAPGMTLQLKPDCKNCSMNIYLTNNK